MANVNLEKMSADELNKLAADAKKKAREKEKQECEQQQVKAGKLVYKNKKTIYASLTDQKPLDKKLVLEIAKLFGDKLPGNLFEDAKTVTKMEASEE